MKLSELMSKQYEPTKEQKDILEKLSEEPEARDAIVAAMGHMYAEGAIDAWPLFWMCSAAGLAVGVLVGRKIHF